MKSIETFPGGEPNVKVKETHKATEISIKIQRFDAMGLACQVDAIRRAYMSLKKLNLFIPYFPGARQDRVCNEGEALTVKVYADFVNTLGFDKVTIMDPHSDVAPALINNCVVIPHGQLSDGDEVLTEFILGKARSDESVNVVAPDAGARKKVLDAIKRCVDPSRVNFIQGDKIRDVQTGKLSGFDFNPKEAAVDRPTLIMDDVNCNGGTFIGLSDKLKEAGFKDITLFTTHLDHKKGAQNILASSSISHYITTNSNTPIEGLGPEEFTCYDIF